MTSPVPPPGRRQREAWLLSLPVEERVRIAYGDEDELLGERVLTTRPELVVEGGDGSGPRRIVGTGCAFPNCDRPRKAKNRLCGGHRNQWQRHRALRPLGRVRKDAGWRKVPALVSRPGTPSGTVLEAVLTCSRTLDPPAVLWVAPLAQEGASMALQETG